MSRTTAVAACFAMVISLSILRPAVGQDGGGDDAVAIFNQAQDLHEKGDLAGAIKLYEKALTVVPEFPEAEYQLGTALLALGGRDDAEKAFRKAVELRPEWSLALAKLGEVLVSKYSESKPVLPAETAAKLYTEASDTLTKALEAEPNNFPALAALTELRLAAGESPTELKTLLEKIKLLTDGKSNSSSAMWSARGSLEDRLGAKDAAKASFERAVAADPSNRSALLQLAIFILNAGDVERAKDIAAKLRTLAADPDTLELLNANIYAVEGDLDAASKQLDLIKKPSINSTDLRSRINTTKNTSPADLEKQLATDPNNVAVLGKLCVVYRRDDPAKALGYCRRASEAEPANLSHAIGFAAALVQAKQYDQAVNILRKLLQFSSDNSTIHANLAAALFQLKRYPEAKAEYIWLTNAQPSSPAAYFLLAIVHDQMNEYLDAMANYQQFLKLADPVRNKLDIEKVNLRLPGLQRQIKRK